jgi:hypothetical protein
LTLSPIGAAAIPIAQERQHPRLWFPANVQDIQSVLGLVPLGSLEGLSSVHLESGKLYVNRHGTGETRDPFLSRKGEEFTPGVWVPEIRGTYAPDTMAICLFGCVLAPDVNVTPGDRLELRFRMLRTLVHELAHHQDRMRRVARGRWRMDDERKAEWYADILTRRWCADVVVPYLREVCE